MIEVWDPLRPPNQMPSNPKMAQYIFGARNKIHIVNLEKTPARRNSTKHKKPYVVLGCQQRYSIVRRYV